MSKEERELGAKLIEKCIAEESHKYGVKVESIIWDKDLGGHISSSERHTIHVKSKGKELSLIDIPDEKVTDYPGKVGNENLNALIAALVKKLC